MPARDEEHTNRVPSGASPKGVIFLRRVATMAYSNTLSFVKEVSAGAGIAPTAFVWANASWDDAWGSVPRISKVGQRGGTEGRALFAQEEHGPSRI